MFKQKRKNLFMNIFLIIGFLFVCFFAFSKNIDITFFKQNDKIVHTLSFFILSFFLSISFIHIKLKIKIIFLFFFGIFIEVVQHYVGRDASMYDFLFDVLGISIFLFIFYLFKLFKFH